MTGQDVTEVVGGARGLTEADLGRCYDSDVDPRLNYEQALEMAFLIARRIAKQAQHPAACTPPNQWECFLSKIVARASSA